MLVLEGDSDHTIPRGYMKYWRNFGGGPYRHVVLKGGDHYFVSKMYREVGLYGCSAWLGALAHG